MTSVTKMTFARGLANKNSPFEDGNGEFLFDCARAEQALYSYMDGKLLICVLQIDNSILYCLDHQRV